MREGERDVVQSNAPRRSEHSLTCQINLLRDDAAERTRSSDGRVPTQTISDDGYGQRGLVVPDLSERCIENLNSACVFRAKRSVNEGSVNYWNGHHLFSKWNGKPKTFDYCD